MDEKDRTISDLKMELAKWRGRSIEAVEMACTKCRNNDLELCRYCRMDRIRREAGYGGTV